MWAVSDLATQGACKHAGKMEREAASCELSAGQAAGSKWQASLPTQTLIIVPLGNTFQEHRPDDAF